MAICVHFPAANQFGDGVVQCYPLLDPLRAGLIGNSPCRSECRSDCSQEKSDKRAFTLAVIVQSLAGERLEFDLEVTTSTTVQAVKFKIFDHWKIAPAFQKLVVGPRVLDPQELLVAYDLDNSVPMNVLMVLCREELDCALKDPDCSMRCAAIKCLVKKGVSSGGRHTVDLLIRCLRDSDGHVRAEAAAGLAKAIELGDEEAFAALASVTDDTDVCVRLGVLRTLIAAMHRGDKRAQPTVIAALTDLDQLIRGTAVTALSDVAQTEHEAIIAAVSERMAEDELTRKVAVQVLGELARTTDECAISLMKAALDDHSWMVRGAAEEAVSHFESRTR